MCKLFAIVEIENKKNAEVFTKAAIPLITKTDNHGLGIMRLGENGVHIQRWLEPPTVVRKKRCKVLMKYQKVLKHQENEEGIRSRNLYAIAVHGRFATCARTLENTHPFYLNGAALMHNGVISNSHEFDSTVSTCDSEALLSEYLRTDVRAEAGKLTEAMASIRGYYAAIVFNDTGAIDIWRDSAASLYMAHVRGVGVVIATTPEIITAAAKRCKALITGLDEILPFSHLRWTRGVFPVLSSFEKTSEAVSGYTPTEYISSGAGALDKREKWWETEEYRKRMNEDLDIVNSDDGTGYRGRTADEIADELADEIELDKLKGIKKGRRYDLAD
jgi:hypothetical protein